MISSKGGGADQDREGGQGNLNVFTMLEDGSISGNLRK